MSLFRSIVFTAALTGVIVGGAVSAAQFAGTSQLIAKAEVYEKAGGATETPEVASPMTTAHVPEAVTITTKQAGSRQTGRSGWPSRLQQTC